MKGSMQARRDGSDGFAVNRKGISPGVIPLGDKEPVRREGKEPVRTRRKGAGDCPLYSRGGWGQQPQNP